MANVRIYSKWDQQGTWNGPWATSTASYAVNSSLVPVSSHAERLAWKEAWPDKFRKHINDSLTFFPDTRTYEIKIWVDQQICPSCQKWMIINVISDLKQLKDYISRQPNPRNLPCKVNLWAEVRRQGTDNKIQVHRDTVWPGNIGFCEKYSDMPSVY